MKIHLLTISLLVGLIVTAATPLSAAAAQAKAKPNILLVVVDTLRRDHVGCFGYERETTPTIDRLAREGVKFEQAVSASSWTLPSMMTMFTSLPPTVHGVLSFSNALPTRLTTLATELGKAGYQRVAITSNPTTHHKFGFGRGFGLYDDFSVELAVKLNLFDDMPPDDPPLLSRTSEKVTDLAVSWLKHERDPEKPFFLHVLYVDPHLDYVPPAPYDTMFTDPDYRGQYDGTRILDLFDKKISEVDQRHLVALYDGEVRYVDDQLGRLMARLKEMGLYDNTIVIVTSDHGEEFWDHGGINHGHTLYDELVRVPLVIRLPAGEHAGSVVRDQVRHIDYMPTLLDFVGLPVPAQCAGASFSRMLSGRPARDEAARLAYIEAIHGGQLRAVRTPTRKLVDFATDARMEMYRLKADPAEKRDLSTTPLAASFVDLQRALADWTEMLETVASTNEPSAKADIDPALLRRLRSLGYAK